MAEQRCGALAMGGLSVGMACTAPRSASLAHRHDITFEWDLPHAGLLESVDFSLAKFLGQMAEKKSLHCGMAELLGSWKCALTKG